MTIDHDEAMHIAQGLGTTYTSPSDEAVRKVFAAYLDAVRRLQEVKKAAVYSTPTRKNCCTFCGGGHSVGPHAYYCPLHGFEVKP